MRKTVLSDTFHFVFQLILVYVLLVGVVFSLVNALGFSSEGQEQDVRLSQGQSTGSFGGGRQGGIGQPGGSGGGAAVSRPGAEGRSYGRNQYGGQPGEDARQYNFRIYTEPEYYGYESKFPGGKATFKSYRSPEARLGESAQTVNVTTFKNSIKTFKSVIYKTI